MNEREAYLYGHLRAWLKQVRRKPLGGATVRTAARVAVSKPARPLYYLWPCRALVYALTDAVTAEIVERINVRLARAKRPVAKGELVTQGRGGNVVIHFEG